MIEERGGRAHATGRMASDDLARIGPLRPEDVLAAAKRGASDPGDLAPDDIQAVCRMLLIQFAQMGIG